MEEIRFGIYKHYDLDGNIIYVGQSTNLLSRQKQHLNTSDHKDYIAKIEIADAKNKTLMDLYEVYYINKHTPKYNKKDNRGDDVSDLNGLGDLDFFTHEVLDELIEKRETKEIPKDKYKHAIHIIYYKELDKDSKEFSTTDENEYYDYMTNKEFREVWLWYYNTEKPYHYFEYSDGANTFKREEVSEILFTTEKAGK